MPGDVVGRAWAHRQRNRWVAHAPAYAAWGSGTESRGFQGGAAPLGRAAMVESRAGAVPLGYAASSARFRVGA